MLSCLNFVKQGGYGSCGDYIPLMCESLMSQIGLHRFCLCPGLAYVGFVDVLNWFMWFFYILNIGWRNEGLHQQTFALFPAFRPNNNSNNAHHVNVDTQWLPSVHRTTLHYRRLETQNDLMAGWEVSENQTLHLLPWVLTKGFRSSN